MMFIVEKLETSKKQEGYKSHLQWHHPGVNTVKFWVYFQYHNFFYIIFNDGITILTITANTYIVLTICQAQFQGLYIY